MAKKRKPQVGVCGVCGIPVGVWIRSEMTWETVAEVGWKFGHQRDDDGQLLKVRCPKHGGQGFRSE